MKHIIIVKGRQIAVNANSGSQVAAYKRLYAGYSDRRLDELAAETVASVAPVHKLVRGTYPAI